MSGQKFRRVFVGLAAAVALAGCFKVSNSMPADAPAFVHAYPGAAQIVAVDVGAMKSVAFQAAATPDQVMSFYRGQAQTDGMPEGQAPPQSGAPAGQQQAVFGDPNGDKFLVVVARPQGNATMVSLTYKPPPKS